MTLDLTRPPFQTRGGMPMHFVGQTKDGRTVWEHEDGAVFLRNADGRVYGDRPSDADIINGPTPKVKETLWANIYPPYGSAPRGFLYSTLELAKAKSVVRVIDTVPVEVEYTPKEPT